MLLPGEAITFRSNIYLNRWQTLSPSTLDRLHSQPFPLPSAKGEKNLHKIRGEKKHEGPTSEFRTSLCADILKDRQKTKHTAFVLQPPFCCCCCCTSQYLQISHQILLLSGQVSASDFVFFNILFSKKRGKYVLEQVFSPPAAMF